MIQLKVISTVHLAKLVARDLVARDLVARDLVARDLVARDMVARGTRHILVTASVAGTMPTPLLAAYGATKAVDQLREQHHGGT